MRHKHLDSIVVSNTRTKGIEISVNAKREHYGMNSSKVFREVVDDAWLDMKDMLEEGKEETEKLTGYFVEYVKAVGEEAGVPHEMIKSEVQRLIGYKEQLRERQREEEVADEKSRSTTNPQGSGNAEGDGQRKADRY